MKLLTHQCTVLALAIALVLITATAASAQQVYYDVNEGGWVDTKNNLVWGLDYTYFTTSSPDGYTLFIPPYPVDWPTAQNMAANYPALLAQNGWFAAANVAANWQAQGLGWRQPTRLEVTLAYGTGFLNKIYADYQTLRWTSSTKLSNKGKKGILYPYVIYLSTGTVELNIADPGFPLFVRRYR